MDLTLFCHLRMTIVRPGEIEHFQRSRPKKLGCFRELDEVGRSLAAAAKCDARLGLLANEPGLLDLENHLSLLRDLHRVNVPASKIS